MLHWIVQSSGWRSVANGYENKRHTLQRWNNAQTLLFIPYMATSYCLRRVSVIKPRSLIPLATWLSRKEETAGERNSRRVSRGVSSTWRRISSTSAKETSMGVSCIRMKSLGFNCWNELGRSGGSGISPRGNPKRLFSYCFLLSLCLSSARRLSSAALRALTASWRLAVAPLLVLGSGNKKERKKTGIKWMQVKVKWQLNSCGTCTC